jgi:hypothetical protein
MLWQPDLIVDVEFLRTEDGGRKGVLCAEYYSCPLEFENEYFDCRLDLSAVGSIAPGDCARLPLKFLFPENILTRLVVGAQFRLWEGRIIGHGTVVSLAGETP